MRQDTVKARRRIERCLETISIEGYLLHSRVADALGLHPTDLQALHLLRGAGSMTAGQLGAALCLTSGSVTALIKRLEDRCYVVRTSDPTDRRRVLVERSIEGTSGIRAEYAAIDSDLETTLDSFNPSELDVISRFLSAITDR